MGIENIASNIIRKEKKLDVIGNYNPEAIDNSKRNPFHPEAMTDDQAKRYGMCHDMARKVVQEKGGDFYTTSNKKHCIAIKGGKVYDYVLGYDFDIGIEEYLKKVPYSFEKSEITGNLNKKIRRRFSPCL